MKINLIAGIFGTDGYTSHGRQLANSLMDVGIDVRLETNLMSGWESQVNDNELEAIKKEEDIERINIFIGQPTHWKTYLNENKKFIGFLVWEGDKIPKFWIPILKDKRVNQIWVPSRHTLQAIKNTCMENDKKEIYDKLKVIPHGVDKKMFYKIEDFKRTSDKFTFLCNKGWRGTSQDRGGVQFLIKAFTDEFRREENVRLIVKLNPAYINPMTFDSCLKSLDMPEDHADLLLNADNLPFKAINRLYNDADCYIVTQMADAFDLGSAEAMATSIPAIMSGYGGQIEHNLEDNEELFISEGNMVEVKEDTMYEGTKWFQPDIKDIRRKLRWAFEYQDEIKELGEQSKNLILRDFSWEETSRKAKEALEEL